MLLLLPALLAMDNTATMSELAPLRPLRKAAAPSIPKSAYDQAFRGEMATGLQIVDGVEAGKAWGLLMLDLPAAAVWKAVNSDELFANVMPVTHSVVVSGRQHAYGRVVFQYMPLPLVDDRWWLTKMYFNEKLFTQSGGRMMELYWSDVMDRTDLLDEELKELVEDGYPVDFTHGSWMVVDLGENQSLIEYYVWSDPGGSIPAGPASQFAGGAVDDTLLAAAKLAEMHAKKGTPGYVYPDGTPVP